MTQPFNNRVRGKLRSRSRPRTCWFDNSINVIDWLVGGQSYETGGGTVPCPYMQLPLERDDGTMT